MFEIIILFVVVSIISNIIKAVGKPKPIQTQRETTVGEVSYDFNEAWVSEKNVEKPVTKTAKISRAKPKVAPRPVIESRKIPQVKPQSKIELTNLTPNRLVEGIVLSEILAPPKSRRQKIK